MSGWGLTITQKVMLGTSLLGCVAGVAGTFAVLRRRALVGDMLAHAALPGICLAFILVGGYYPAYARMTPVLAVGAFVTSLIGVAVMTFVCRWTRTKEDAAIGIVLSTFFGAGIVLLAVIQNLAIPGKAGLSHLLFGSAAAMLTSDILIISSVSLLCLTVLAALYKEFKAYSFDPEFAQSQGWPGLVLDLVMMGIVAVVTIVGLPIVGVVLMAAMIILPSTTARFWTNQLGQMLVLSGIVGATMGVGGTLISAGRGREAILLALVLVPAMMTLLRVRRLRSRLLVVAGAGCALALLAALLWSEAADSWLPRRTPGLPTGPVIVLSGTALFLFSMFFAPERGVAARVIAESRLRRKTAHENLLRQLYELSEPDLPRLPVIPLAGLMEDRAWNRTTLRWALRWAARRGLIQRTEAGIALTENGLKRAVAVTRTHRLWELFLIEGAQIAPDHVDRDADAVEHLLTPELIEDLETRLAETGRLPSEAGAIPASPHRLAHGPTAREESRG